MGTTDNFCLRWNDFQSNISSSFREIRQGSEFFDVTLCCDDGESRLQAHRVILAACSPLLRKVLSCGNNTQQQQHQLLYLKGVDLVHLSAVLDFMYHGEVNVSQEDLASFLKVAEELSVKGLTDREPKTEEEQEEDGGGGAGRGRMKASKKASQPHSQLTTSSGKKRKVDSAASVKPSISAPAQHSSSGPSMSMKTSPVHGAEPGSDAVAGRDDYVEGGGGETESGEMGEYGFDDYEVDDSNYGLEGTAREDQGEIVVENEEAIGKEPYADSSGVGGVEDYIVRDPGGAFWCQACSHRASRKQDMVRHVERRHHSQGYDCQYCRQQFRARDQLLRHIRFVHSAKKHT